MNKKLKLILSCFFILVISVSFGVLVYSFFAGDEEPNYEDAPAEIIVADEEKEIVEINDKESIMMAPDVDLNQMRIDYNNDDIVGRLELPNMFNILIVQSNDNSYYLNHSIYKDKDVRGSEFMDYRVTALSKQINIYGHNSRDKNIGVPFLRLESFLDESYFDSNPYIIFQHDSGKSVYKITAIKEVTTAEHMTVTKTGSDFVEQVNFFKKDAIYTREVEFDENSDIIVLQTCSHNLEDAYYLIVGIKMDY